MPCNFNKSTITNKLSMLFVLLLLLFVFAFLSSSMSFAANKTYPKSFDTDLFEHTKLVEAGIITNLMLASMSGDIEETTKLLNEGANPNEKNADGATALLFTADTNPANATEIAEKLLQHGANPNDADVDGTTTSILAARNNNVALLNILIKYGADLNQTNVSGETPLIIAAEKDSFETIDILLDKGVDPNKAEHKGMMTALTWLYFNSHKEKTGDTTPTTLEFYNKRINIVKKLLDHNADPNKENISGATPLIFAALYDHIELLDILLDKDADPFHTEKDGTSTLTYAKKNHYTKIVKKLQERMTTLRK